MTTVGSILGGMVKPGVKNAAQKASDVMTNPWVNLLTGGHSGVLAGSVIDALNTKPSRLICLD